MVFVAPEVSRYSGGVDRDQPPVARGRADRVQGCILLDIASPEIGSLRFWECSHRFPQQFDSAFQALPLLGSVFVTYIAGAASVRWIVAYHCARCVTHGRTPATSSARWMNEPSRGQSR